MTAQRGEASRLRPSTQTTSPTPGTALLMTLGGAQQGGGSRGEAFSEVWGVREGSQRVPRVLRRSHEGF
eukprot:8865838-Pyramimonas_sp.AAC.1